MTPLGLHILKNSFFFWAVCCSMPFAVPTVTDAATYASSRMKVRKIAKVAAVKVECPVGTAPQLPYLVWVTYSDGKSEYRQVRWTNAPLAVEQEEADASKHPKGTEYAIAGYVIGDETTDNGFPIKAQVKMVADKSDHPQQMAHTFSLADVCVDGDNRLTHNRDEAIREICSWDVTQQLYNYRDTYGLSTDGYTKSDGWDSPDTKLKGHGSGHYMSAIAQAYAVTTDPQLKAILRQNIMRMVNELRACQERTFIYNKELNRYWEARDFAPVEELRRMKGTWAAFDEYKKHPEQYGYGYLNAIPAQHCALIEMYRAYNNSDWVWAPYYSVHKQLAGLIDIATYFDEPETVAKALLIAKDMGLWVWNRLHYRTYLKVDGTPDERRAKPGNRYEMWDMYIAGEVGGMSEVLARLSEMVSDKEEKAKLIEAANYFDAPKFFDPLAKNIDAIRGRHANQHIPMIIGALRSYKSNHQPYYYHLAENFWNLVQGRYVYATGGVGNGEMFRQPYTQMLSMATNGVREGESKANSDLNETCCAYNLLKLTRDLNTYHLDDACYMDYYERTLYNQIIGSLNPDKYQTTYQYAVGLNASKPFGNETPQSTCCGGTGSENHTKYQEATYFASDSTLWVGLYMPTTLHWKQKGITLSQECGWPAQRSVIKVTDGEGNFTLKLRVPYWATEGFSVKVNGERVSGVFQPSSYVALPRQHWMKGDVVEVEMPFTKHIMYGADKLSCEVASMCGTPLKSAWVGALMYGPLVMTGTGVQDWNQAMLNLDSRLEDVSVDASHDIPVGASHDILVDASNGTSVGVEANLLTLKVGDRLFEPDYYRNVNSTHYYRILSTDAQGKGDKKSKGVDFAELKMLLSLAEQRKADQEAWQVMRVKTPEYAPWAPFGYKRMTEAMAQAALLMKRGEKKVISEELEGAVSALNRAINTMRPGNLAEMEDLRPLSELLRSIGKIDDTASASLKEAVKYGKMVMRYVADGSGTQDMIKAAIGKLQKK